MIISLKVPCNAVLAQSVDFLPEIDARFKLKSNIRAYVQAKDERDAGAPDQFAIGPSLQIYVKLLLRLKNITVFDLDDAKPRALILEAGYRYITAPDTALIADRNRADLDSNGTFDWR